MGVLNKCRVFIEDCYDALQLIKARHVEIQKFNDKRRKAIYSKENLTKEEIEEIDSLYKSTYGKKIPYTWHKHFKAFSGTFDVNYFPELLFIPEFEHFENAKYEYCQVYADKNVISLIAKSLNIKMPNTIISKCAGIFRDENYGIISYDDVLSTVEQSGDLFIKPTLPEDTSSGRNCRVINIESGCDHKTGDSIIDILEGYGDDFVIQEKIVCHDLIRQIFPGSVNTFRIITYRWQENGESVIKHGRVAMRVGRGDAVIDGTHAGGMLLAIDDNGRIHKTAVTEFNEHFDVHPDTGIRFESVNLGDMVIRCIDEAKRLHGALPQVGCYNWDFTVDQAGDPVLIEANTLSGSVWLAQMPHDVGIFDNTPDILKWTGMMKKIRKSKRAKYYYGSFGGDDIRGGNL